MHMSRRDCRHWQQQTESMLENKRSSHAKESSASSSSVAYRAEGQREEGGHLLQPQEVQMLREMRER